VETEPDKKAAEEKVLAKILTKDSDSFSKRENIYQQNRATVCLVVLSQCMSALQAKAHSFRWCQLRAVPKVVVLVLRPLQDGQKTRCRHRADFSNSSKRLLNYF